jgi:hypothetical protein
MTRRKNPDLPLQTTLRRKTWEPVLFQGCPKWQRSVRRVEILGDVSRLTFPELDYLFAIFASNGGVQFDVAAEAGIQRWLESVGRRSVGAAEKYERRMRAHFERYKLQFREGYSLPEPPTPQLRLIYDSAAQCERRPSNPCGTTLYAGFSGGEYHWRKWPLDNVSVKQKELL